MRRTLLSICLPLAAALLMWGVRDGQPCAATACPTAADGPRPVAETPSCKPEAPIVVTLAVPDAGSGDGSRASFSIRPVLELSDLRWSWELGAGVTLVEGEPQGAAAPQRGALTEGEVRLYVPDDGRHHTAKLIVTGVLAGGGEHADGSQDAGPETVAVLRTLSWGEPEPEVQTVLSPDADTGALVPVAVVPGSHQPAPAAPRGAGR